MPENIKLTTKNSLITTNKKCSVDSKRLKSVTNTTYHGDNKLWSTNPREFLRIRKGFLGFNNIFTKTYSNNPQAETIYLSPKNPVNPHDRTQPTMRSCNLTSILIAINDFKLPFFKPEWTIKEKFEYIINDPDIITPDERDRLFKQGLTLEELSEIANRIFKKDGLDLQATAYSTPDVSMEQFISLLLTDGNRSVANFGSAFLYGLEGNGGHFAYIDTINIGKDDQIYIHPVDPADYKYPADAWIPVEKFYEAMCQPGTDGKQRGFIILSKL